MGGGGHVSGGSAGIIDGGGRLCLTPAQVALQQQLKSKHAELSRRIALQQAELLRLGEQLALTYRDPNNAIYNQQQQQQQNIIDHDHINAAQQQQHLQQQQQQQQQYLTSPSQPHILQSPMMGRSQPQQMTNLVLQQQQQQHQQQHMNGMNVGFEDVLQH